MKISILLITVLLSLSGKIYADESKTVQHHDAEELELDTHDLGIYNDIEKLINKSKTIKNKSFGQVEPFLGLPMRYPTFPHQAAEANIGIATSQNGMPIVIYGPYVAQQLGPLIMGFFMQHEYAHHDLRHNPNMGINSATREAQADCQAAKVLAQNGRTDAIMTTINWFQSQGCNYDPRISTQFVTDSHPCGAQRAQIIYQCAKN